MCAWYNNNTMMMGIECGVRVCTFKGCAPCLCLLQWLRTRRVLRTWIYIIIIIITIYIYIYSLGTFFFYSSSIFEWISGTDIRNRIYEALFCRSGGKRYDVIRVEETIELNSFFCLSHSSPWLHSKSTPSLWNTNRPSVLYITCLNIN